MKRPIAVQAGLFLLSITAAAGNVQAQGLVSSDGAELAITGTEVRLVDSAPFKGTGRMSLEALSVEGAIFESVPMSELMASRPMTAGIGVETILGTDSRVRVFTNRFPQRAIGLITFSTTGGTSLCSGWLIGKDTVATAGHCVAAGGSKKFYSISSYRFYAGKNGSASPYGSCTARTLYTSSNWYNKGLDDYDFGLIKLNCTIGNTVGWFGFFYTTASLLNEVTVISGYPGDKPLDQWQSVDKVRVVEPKRLFYKNDSVGGMSGSPVFSDRPPGAPFAANGLYGIGVHTYGVYGDAPYNTHNHATRIDKSVYDAFMSVKNAP